MDGAGAITSAELASKTNLNERYVREWLRAIVAAEYIVYDKESQKYLMSAEQAFVLSKEDSPMFVGGGFHFTAPSLLNVPRIMDAFKNGDGIPYSEIGDEIAPAIERFFRPGYVNSLSRVWLGAVPELIAKLEKGITVGDVGCGRGQSTVAMAKAYPNSRFLGIDYDGRSITAALELAGSVGLTNAEFRPRSRRPSST